VTTLGSGDSNSDSVGDAESSSLRLMLASEDEVRSTTVAVGEMSRDAIVGRWRGVLLPARNGENEYEGIEARGPEFLYWPLAVCRPKTLPTRPLVRLLAFSVWVRHVSIANPTLFTSFGLGHRHRRKVANRCILRPPSFPNRVCRILLMSNPGSGTPIAGTT